MEPQHRPKESWKDRWGRRFRTTGWVTAAVSTICLVLVLVAYFTPINYAYRPASDEVLNAQRVNLNQGADLWGRAFTHAEVARLHQTEEGRRYLSPANGAVLINANVLELGKRSFYEESFGNEVFLTDITGMLDGPVTLWSVSKAVMAARWKGTSNLQVELASDADIGDRTFRKGQMIDTGLDVPKGAWAPMGIVVKKERGAVRVGISCAACHSTVDPVSKQVVEGAPNLDFNLGTLLAMATNSAAFWPHADIQSLTPFMTDPARTTFVADGSTTTLPDPGALERAVDEVFMRWPSGTFDSTIDLVANPTQIPDSFTLEDHPYGWSGFATAGPFRGLSSLNNNVHALNSDTLTNAPAALELFGVDAETYHAVVLQNAARPTYRFQPGSRELPSVFFQSVDPTPKTPATNSLVKLPTFPSGSIIAPTAMWVSKEGLSVWEQVNAMSAFQNSLTPPRPAQELTPEALAQGREVFERARCATCHTGPALTNNRIIPAPDLGAEPTRARALKRMERILVPPVAWPFDTPVPVPESASGIAVPILDIDQEQLRLAWARGDSPGGYKVKGLAGLRWTPPYLHDSGVSAGPDAAAQVGLPGTLYKGIAPDPANSLRALVDRQLRSRVVEANAASEAARRVNALGIGHEHWVDSAAGFSPEEQDALIQYLLDIPTPLEANPTR